MTRLQEFHEDTLSDAPMGSIVTHQFPALPMQDREENLRLLRRRRLIAAAAELFSRQGYKSTTLREIAIEATCSESFLRREFGGKLGLLEEVIRACGVCDGVQAPREFGRPSLQEDVRQLTSWEVARMRGQRECLQALLPRDSFDPLVMQVAGRLSLAGSTDVLHERLSTHRIADAEREFLVCAIQAVGFALGWTGFEEPSQMMLKVRQVANTLAGGIESGRA